MKKESESLRGLFAALLLASACLAIVPGGARAEETILCNQ